MLTVGCGTVHILVIEDESKLAAAISHGLQAEGYAVAAAHSGEAGLKLLRENQFDLLLLDVMLPRKGGIETLRDLRRDGFKMPVLILTSRDSIDDRVLGLDAGADDYLVKPYAFPELLARGPRPLAEKQARIRFTTPSRGPGDGFESKDGRPERQGA